MFKGLHKVLDIIGIFFLAVFLYGHSPKLVFANYAYDQIGLVSSTETSSYGADAQIDGDILAVKSHTDSLLWGYGEVYIYKKINYSWVLQTIIASDYSYSYGDIALSGNTLAISKKRADGSTVGFIDIYEYDGSSWIQQVSILMGEGAQGHSYSSNIVLEGDILAYDYQDISFPSYGLDSPVFVYSRNDGVWSYQTTLVPDGGYGGKISIDNNTLAVVAPNDPYTNGRGGANIFVYDGENWTKQALVHVNTVAPGSRAILGDISLKGDVLATSSYNIVYFFYRTGSTWITTINYLNYAYTPRLPNAIHLADENNVFISARVDENILGEVYHYARSGGAWGYVDTLPRSDGQYDDSYGEIVFGYENTILVGAPKWWNDNIGRGKVYVYDFHLANLAPIANSGFDQTVNEGDIISFDGSGSSDPDGVDDIVSYEWDFGDGNFSSGITAQHTYDDNGIYTVTLTVADSFGEVSIDTTLVTVNNVVPTASFEIFPNTIFQGESSTLIFSDQFDPGPDDTFVGFTYSFDCTNDGVFELANSLFSSYICTYPDTGSYVSRGEIKDKDGGYSEYTQTVIVQTPSEAILALIDLVTTFNIQQGIDNALDGKLAAALSTLDDVNTNNDVAAVNSLYSFIYTVEAQQDHLITSEQADILITEAQIIIDSLSL